MPSIDLNADLGEGPGGDAVGGGEAALLDVVTSASIACGGHAGTPQTMVAAVEAAMLRGVVVGAHPSYPDRDGFGRRHVEMTGRELADAVHQQVGALVDVARGRGGAVRYVKPHGALYNELAHDPGLADVVTRAVRSVDRELVLMLLAGSPAVEVAEALGMSVAREAFADRAYRSDARLLARGRADALLTDPTVVARRALSLATEGRVESADGRDVFIRADSLCVHGDTPGALTLATGVRRALEDAGVTLAAFVA